MRLDQLIFVGLNGYVAALDRESGEIVWSQKNLESGYVTLMLDGDRLIVSCNGYMFALDPLSGDILWNNRMKGYGSGTPTAITSVRGSANALTTQYVSQMAAASMMATSAAIAASS